MIQNSKALGGSHQTIVVNYRVSQAQQDALANEGEQIDGLAETEEGKTRPWAEIDKTDNKTIIYYFPAVFPSANTEQQILDILKKYKV